MTTGKVLRWVFAALVCVLVLPASARAQSAIAGIVRDTSGAVMPGVTVEASSDVLIEKTRSAVTDGEGAYRIVDLRPGVYVVTFSLTGFQTIRREGLELPSNFTATVNADLSVGALEESVTVSGSSPVVDVQTNAKAQVLHARAPRRRADRPHDSGHGSARRRREPELAGRGRLARHAADLLRRARHRAPRRRC